ncbi:hypothetical protein [Allosalinactinospora lopnorensis]|uniref:hypothetical protein n=1 Tax=Allosalinactinospora lopnorensis TaxID=1352348 RepID=UPI000623D99A|nr:hypothetical protein [Allosalinactinospora lopnorensis]
MFAIAGLVTVTVLGLLAVGFFAVRLLAQVRRLREQVARTRDDLEPHYRGLRSKTDRARVDIR